MADATAHADVRLFLLMYARIYSRSSTARGEYRTLIDRTSSRAPPFPHRWRIPHAQPALAPRRLPLVPRQRVHMGEGLGYYYFVEKLGHSGIPASPPDCDIATCHASRSMHGGALVKRRSPGGQRGAVTSSIADGDDDAEGQHRDANSDPKQTSTATHDQRDHQRNHACRQHVARVEGI
jgi:hypothetical protein